MRKIYQNVMINIYSFNSQDVITKSPNTPNEASVNGFYGLESSFVGWL